MKEKIKKSRPSVKKKKKDNREKKNQNPKKEEKPVSKRKETLLNDCAKKSETYELDEIDSLRKTVTMKKKT